MSTHTSTDDAESLHQIKECISQYSRSLVSASYTFVDSSCHLVLTLVGYGRVYLQRSTDLGVMKLFRVSRILQCSMFFYISTDTFYVVL